MMHHTRQAFFIQYFDYVDSNAKTTCRNGFIHNYFCRTLPNTLNCVRKPFIFFYRKSAFPLDFLFCCFLSFLTGVRVLRRVFGMEPSTSVENMRKKRQRKSLYDQRQVLEATPFRVLLRFRQISLQISSSDLCNSQSPKKKSVTKGLRKERTDPDVNLRTLQEARKKMCDIFLRNQCCTEQSQDSYPRIFLRGSKLSTSTTRPNRYMTTAKCIT